VKFGLYIQALNRFPQKGSSISFANERGFLEAQLQSQKFSQFHSIESIAGDMKKINYDIDQS